MQLTHIAKPVRVNAAEILDVTYSPDDGSTLLRLSDGRNFVADNGMCARFAPAPGDYLVTQEDGYEYLNPKDLFERKYRAGGVESLVTITVNETADGMVSVGVAGAPAVNMAAAPPTEAHRIAFLMLAALPMNEPANDAADPVEPKPVRHLPI